LFVLKTDDKSMLADSHGRIMHDLRISVTDRCNFRCLYCLPETEAAEHFYRGRWGNLANSIPIRHEWQPQENLLSFEEIERVVRLGLDLGLKKFRLTGGEPLLRKELERLVGKIADLAGVEDLAMTTNGVLFARKARQLRDAGLKRVSFSLDSLDRENFRKITGRDGLNEVLESIDLACDLGFSPVKVNAVVIRGINDHEIEALASFGTRKNLSVRFIEFMPLDSKRAWQKELVVTGKEILARLQSIGKLNEIPSASASETARRWSMPGGTGEIGIIAPVSEPFCGHCNRLRLTADGKIRTCLFSVVEHDLKELLRNQSSDVEIRQFMQTVVQQKEDRHRIGEPNFVQPKRTMSCIGG
ncbi:MAG: GTP 3',8-cyclase MoaA, partial [Limisphaerales bacterium]